MMYLFYVAMIQVERIRKDYASAHHYLHLARMSRIG